MKNGYKVIDMDTHVGPSMETIIKHMDPSFKERVSEFDAYRRYRKDDQGNEFSMLGTAVYVFDRFPGTAPSDEPMKPKPKGAGQNEGRTSAGGHHRVKPRPGTQEENVEGRLQDMDMEGRDVDLIFPAAWLTGVIGLPDISLSEGLYRAYHNYQRYYCGQNPKRLRGVIHVPGNDIEWAVAEVKALGDEDWVAGVRPNLPENMPVDHPDLDPLWEVMNDMELPFIFHSCYYEPPYFPGYRDIWGNAAVARTAAHPWSAARLASYLIVGRIFDRFPNIKALVAEVGHGWLPHWLIRLGEMTNYVSGTTPALDYKPLEYAQMGRFVCSAEPMEGPAMTKACIDILGDGNLMHQSDYPHGEAHFPDTAQMVMDWPIWEDFGKDVLTKYMSGNAEKFLGSRL